MLDDSSARPLRYAVHDEYVLEEIRGRFVHGNRQERLQLLAEVYAAKPLPYELARLVLEDPDPMIRRWMARSAIGLDLRERDYEARSGTDVARSDTYKYPDRNLWERLRDDPDPFVRAALQENRDHATLLRFANLARMTHMERLAIMRNPSQGHVSDGILELLDPAVDGLGVSMQQREELLLAYLTNPSAIKDSRTEHPFESWMDAASHYEAEKQREQFWQLVSTFPGHDIRDAAFRHFGGKDAWKAAAYAATDSKYLRLTIISNALDTDVQTLELARKDEDEFCRDAAAEKRVVLDSKPKKRAGRILHHMWTAASGLVFLAITALILSKAVSPFEHLAAILLVATYLSLTGSVAMMQRLYSLGLVGIDADFRRLRRLAGEKTSFDERYEEAEQAAEIHQTLKKADAALLITGIFHFLIWCLLAYELVTTLL